MTDNGKKATFNAGVLCGDDFDSFGFRRALRKGGVFCSLAQFSSIGELLSKFESEEENLDVLVVDFDSVNADDAEQLYELFQRVETPPCLGLFGKGSGHSLARAMDAGLDEYLCKDNEAVYLELLPHMVLRAGARRIDRTQIGRCRETVDRLHREQTALMNASLTLISSHDLDTTIIWSNAYEEDGEVMSVDHLAGRHCREIWKFGGFSDGRCPVATAIKKGESVESEVTTLDGYTMLQRAYPVKDEDGNVIGAIASTLDMSAISPAQEVVRTAARVQASATLAGGIAHKFNNLMAGVMGNVSLILNELGAEHSTSELLREIEQAAINAGDLSEQLLAFARGGKYLPKVINLNDVLREMLQVQENNLPTGVDVNTYLDDELWNVEANSAQFSLLLTQILANAVEAYGEGGGPVLITSKNESVGDDGDLRQPWIESGRWVTLSIRDNGCGMNAETRMRAFEPFFTTKAKGRGLGLSGAYGIARSHDGYIWIESEEGEGTTVTVHIPATNIEPLATKEPRLESVPPVTPDKIPTGDETILIVDDEDVLRRAMKRSLARLGYNILAASSGDEALAMVEKYDGEIHLALLDMIMPGMDGMDVYLSLKEARPTMDIIVVSGYDKETYERPLMDAGATAFVQKPISMNDLAGQVRKALDIQKPDQ